MAPSQITPCLLLLALTACTQQHALHPIDHRTETPVVGPALYAHANTCVADVAKYQPSQYRVDRALVAARPIYAQTFNRALPLSVGDLVDVQIEDGEGFTGRYIINADGTLSIAHTAPVQVAGLSEERATQALISALVRAQLFRPESARAAVRVVQWAPIDVTVSGAVFEPGRVRINENNQESVIVDRVAAFGDFSQRRSLTEALRAASGIRPDAKLDQVILVRNGWHIELDLSGVLTGAPARDIALVDGDQIVVPTTGCFQPALVRPSQITPKGFRVFMSNLVIPSLDNAGGAVGRYSSNLPYGTRLLQAAVSANCVGGTQLTNAPRKVVLASRNPLTGDTQVIERSIEHLMRGAGRDDINPYLMPNDALACYDSDISNLRDVARSLADLLAPLKLVL